MGAWRDAFWRTLLSDPLWISHDRDAGSMIERSKYRRGIPAARANLATARLSLERYSTSISQSRTNPYELLLYYGSFFVFLRSAIASLKESADGQSPTLSTVQSTFFRAEIQKHPIYETILIERDRVAHGNDALGAYPFKSEAMVERFIVAGLDLHDAVFDNVWPDGHFKGRPPAEVFTECYKQVSQWIDEIDCLDEAEWTRQHTDNA